MKPVNSENRVHDSPPGTVGDCQRACLASILEMETADVPHFFDYPMSEGGEKGLKAQSEWLQQRDLAYIEIPVHGETVADALHWISAYTGDAHYMLVGKSRSGFMHVVVCRYDQVVHDPTYGKPQGIVGPDENGYWWVGFLVVSKACD